MFSPVCSTMLPNQDKPDDDDPDPARCSPPVRSRPGRSQAGMRPARHERHGEHRSRPEVSLRNMRMSVQTELERLARDLSLSSTGINSYHDRLMTPGQTFAAIKPYFKE